MKKKCLQTLKDVIKPLGYIRALWEMSDNSVQVSPGIPKFMPQFPGRNFKGQVQYAKYKDTIVSMIYQILYMDIYVLI